MTSADQPTCYRRGDPLRGTHWSRLSTDNRGAVADNNRDVTRRICPD